MKVVNCLACLVLIVSGTPICADENKLLLGFEYGASQLNLDSEYENNFDPSLIDETGLSGSYSIAYRWQNNLIVESNLSISGNAFLTFGLFDFYEVSEVKLLVGYSIDLNEHFRLVPLIGLSHWSATLQEGAFLNPGPELSDEIDGTNLTYKLSAEFPFSNGFVVSFSHSNTNSDIGSIRLNQLGIKYEF